MYSQYPVVLPRKKITKDTQIDDTQKQQQCINISNNKYGRSLRQDNSYDNDAIKMMNKTMPYPPPPPYVGGHHPYPTHQYHHPYHMSHHTSKPIYPQPATTTAANNQAATLQYHYDTTTNATASNQQQEEKAASSSSSMTHHHQYHPPPPPTHYPYPPPPTHYAYPHPYTHGVQQSAVQYHHHVPPMQRQYMTSKVSEDQMAALPIKHDGRKRKSILPPPPNEHSQQYQHHHLTSRVSDSDISEKSVQNTKKYRYENYSRQVTTDTHHMISQVAPPPTASATTWPQINNTSTNVIVLPAPKRYTRKRKYCIHEGCKLKQKKGEYCFKHSMAVIHDGSVPEYLIPPTPTANTETPQEVPPTHKAIVHSVDAVSAVLSIAAETKQIQVQPTRTQRDNHLSTVNTDLCNMPKLLRRESRSSVIQVKEVLADHLQDRHVAAVSTSTAAVTQQPQVQLAHTQRDTPSGILGETPREVPHKAVVHSVDAVSASTAALTQKPQVQQTHTQRDNHLSTVNDLCDMPELLRHESRSSVNQLKEILADHPQDHDVAAVSASTAAATQQPQGQPTHTQRDNHISTVNDLCDMPELLRYESRSSVNQLKEVLADHLQEGLVTTSAAVVKEKQPQVQLTHPSAISFAKTPQVVIQPTPLRMQRDNHLSAVKDMYEMPELLRHESTSSVSSKLMAREILGIDSSERSARSTAPKNVPKHVEIANISQIESLGSEDDQLVAFMNEFRDDLESQRGDDNDHILS